MRQAMHAFIQMWTPEQSTLYTYHIKKWILKNFIHFSSHFSFIIYDGNHNSSIRVATACQINYNNIKETVELHLLANNI